MRILRKELVRIFSGKTVLLLAVFTALFIYLFSHWSIYPCNYVDWPGSVPFYEELFREFGGEIAGDQWELFGEKRNALKEELDEIIAQNAYLAGEGITDLDRFEKRVQEIGEKRDSGEEISGEEQEIYNLYYEMWFSDGTYKEIRFRVQECERIEWHRGDGSVALSLVPDAVIQLLPNEFVRLVVLVYVGCAAFLLPWLIEENLKGVYPLFVSTKEGRAIFRRRMKASLVTGICVWAAVAGIYTVLLWWKHYFVFWNGQISNGWFIPWIDLTVLWYWIFHAALLLAASLGCAALAYLIGRVSRNYIAGLVLAIPAGVLYCGAVQFCIRHILSRYFRMTHMLLRAAAFGGVVVLLLLAALWVTKRDRKRDIL